MRTSKMFLAAGSLLMLSSFDVTAQDYRSDFERSLPRIERGELKNAAPAPAERSNMQRLERGELSNMNPREAPREHNLGGGFKGTLSGPAGSQVGGTIKRDFE